MLFVMPYECFYNYFRSVFRLVLYDDFLELSEFKIKFHVAH